MVTINTKRTPKTHKQNPKQPSSVLYQENDIFTTNLRRQKHTDLWVPFLHLKLKKQQNSCHIKLSHKIAQATAAWTDNDPTSVPSTPTETLGNHHTSVPSTLTETLGNHHTSVPSTPTETLGNHHTSVPSTPTETLGNHHTSVPSTLTETLGNHPTSVPGNHDLHIHRVFILNHRKRTWLFWQTC